MQRLLYYAYRGASAFRYWLRHRFTPAGWVAFGGLVASALTGLDTSRNLTYQTFAFLFCLLVLGMVSGLRFRPCLTVRRRLSRFATAGEPCAYRVTVRNQTAALLNGLRLREQEADPRPTREEFFGAAGSVRGYARWRQLIARHQIVMVDEHAVPALPPQGEHDVPVTLLPQRRGRARLAGVTFARLDPFGLFKSFAFVPADDSVLVLPKRYKVPDVSLSGTRKYQSGGVALASSVADSEEFMGLRDYRPGDPLRHIHWKSWAKASKPVVKEYEDEFFVRHALVLDTFLGAASEDAFEEAVSLAASFACSVDTQDSLLDLLFVENQAYCYTAGRGVGGVDRMLEVLAGVQGCRDKSFATLRAAVLGRQQSLSTCICVLLGWDEPRRNFVGELRAAGVQTLVLVVSDPRRVQAARDGAGGGAPGVHHLEVGKIAEGVARL